MTEKSFRAKSLPNYELFKSLSEKLGTMFLSSFKRKIIDKNIIFRNQQIMIISDLYYEINNDTISTSLLQNIF